MNVRLIILTLSITLLINSNIVSANSEWRDEIVQDGLNVAYHYSSLDIDNNNIPHILYANHKNNTLNYGFRINGDWEIKKIAENENGYDAAKLVLDSNNHPHIVYKDRETKALIYAYHNGNEWIFETIQSEDVEGSADLVLDNDDYPHLCYHDYKLYDLKYAYYDGIDWNIQRIKKDGDLGTGVSLALDSKKNPHICVYDDYSWDLKYIYFDGNNWIELNIGEEKKFSGYSIAVDSKDLPHISYCERIYRENDWDWDLKYIIFDGKNWTNETIEGEDYASCSCLIVDENDMPHISYIQISDLKYAFFDGKNWSIKKVNNKPISPKYTCLALDDYKNPHISYNEGRNQSINHAFLANLEENNKSSIKLNNEEGKEKTPYFEISFIIAAAIVLITAALVLFFKNKKK